MRQKISTHVDLGTEWRVLHAQTWDNNLLYDEITYKVDYFFLSKTFLVTYFLIGLDFKVYYCRYGRILILKISSPVIEETRVMWLGLGEAFNLSDNLNHLSMCFLPQDKFKLNFFLANYRREGEEAEKEQSKVVTSGGGKELESGGRREEDWELGGKRRRGEQRLEGGEGEREDLGLGRVGRERGEQRLDGGGEREEGRKGRMGKLWRRGGERGKGGMAQVEAGGGEERLEVG